MAFNKTKLQESAQKFLGQGKIAQAIGEYLQVLRQDPKDQITLMTVGDLCVRLGETRQAVECFEKLAALFLAEGFTSKAIAIYKKIAKLVPEDTHPLTRLAELYTQQGVVSEARSLFLQLAETHLKARRPEETVEVLRKLLEIEPNNLRVRLRLAELYQAIGQEREAALAYLNSAEYLLERNDFTEAQKLAERALKIEPRNAHAAAALARALVGLGKAEDAIGILEGLGEVDAGSEAGELLTELYLGSGRSARAAGLARKAFERDPKRYATVRDVAATLLEGGEADQALALLGEIREAMIEAGDHDSLSQALGRVAHSLPGRLEPLEWQVELCRRTGNSFLLPDALHQLGEAVVAAGQLERAKAVFEELLEREPANEHTLQCLNQVREKLGLGPLEELPAETRKEPAQLTAEAVPTAPIVEAPLDEGTQQYLSQALTDVDLFSSYGLTPKAIDLLENVLQRVPRHAAALEKLLDLYLGAGDDRRTTELAAQLEQIHLKRGDARAAERFGDLKRRFQRAAGMAAEELAAAPPVPPAEFTIPMAEVEPAPSAETAPAQLEEEPEAAPAVEEVDLTEEWAALTQVAAEAREEALASAPAGPQASEGSTEAEPTVLEPAEEAVEYEPEPVASLPAAPAAESAMSSDQFLSELAAEVDELTPRQPAPEAVAPSNHEPAPPAQEESIEQLREVFQEFRAELGEMGAEEEDLETHYNLGIAYREMGLLEEAIGEFQKVAKLIGQGRPFRYVMQCYTLLGLSFMEKAEPKIAAMWYERALQTPGLDQESILALRYDLGIAQELAGETQAALESFSQVYAMNIDYRDVAERLAGLQKQR